jgi:hypothetical protein
MAQTDVIRRTIRVRTLEHTGSGMLVAVSDDMRGLYVHGANAAEINRRIPEAIRSLLEAEGKTVIEVVPLGADDDAAGGFVPLDRTFGAALAA